ISKIKKIMQAAQIQRGLGERTIVFVDEIHRFNKAQQDAFLPYVERGSIILIGATTENPSFEVNSALLSRCQVFVLKPLTTNDIVELLQKALSNPRAFPQQKIKISPAAITAIANFASGDERVALNTLEMAVLNGERQDKVITITSSILQ
ncbi:AAA family ATPase, partial [Lactobacillus sp. XV13L]|nr:AAA family ATPase [Lactobacillus sp. XV13L]